MEKICTTGTEAVCDVVHGGALLLIPGAALLPSLVGALLLVDGLLNGARNIDALLLGDVTALLLELLIALLVDVAGLLALAAVLGVALLGDHSLLLRPLGDATLALRGVSTHLVRHSLALATLDRIKHSPGHLLTHLLGNLAAHRRLPLLLRRAVTLERDITESQDTKGNDGENLHDGVDGREMLG